jgi:hypothetical protein
MFNLLATFNAADGSRNSPSTGDQDTRTVISVANAQPDRRGVLLRPDGTPRKGPRNLAATYP